MSVISALRPQKVGPIRYGWVSTFVLILFSPLAAQAQQDSAALLRAGNEQFRAGHYSSAIRTYEAVRDSGQNSALLDYNLGVAYYKNGDYAAARGALQRAAADPEIAPLAYYNLGLTSRAYGDLADARRWFQLAEAQSTNPQLTSLAQRAVAQSAEENVPATRSAIDSEERFQPYHPDREPAGELTLVLGVRAGQNDNVYRSPGQAYTDPGQAGQPLVTPVVQSASYVPIDLLTLYKLNAEGSDTQFRFLYRLNGDFYDSEFSNANEVTQRFEIGADIDLEGRHYRRLRPAVYFTHHDETNFDPDTGVDREINGEDISDRLSYGSAGLRSSYTHELDYWSFGFNARVERRHYQDVPILASWDHELYDVRMWTGYQVLRNTRLELGVEAMGRHYDSRFSRDLNGDILTTNDTLQYAWIGADIGIEHRLGRNFWIEANFSRLEREDAFEGYADYSRNAARFSLDYRFNQRLRGSLSAVTRQYDYPRAFAFNDPAGGALELDSSSIEFNLDYDFTTSLSLWLALEIRDVTSTDQRIAYDQTLSMIGIKWRR